MTRKTLSQRLFLIAVVVSAAASVANAQTTNRVLLPLYLSQPVRGAYGSIWQSEFAVHNGTTREFIIDWCTAIGPNEACQLDLWGDEALEPDETQTALPARYPAPANGVVGAVVYLFVAGAPPADLSGISFQLRIADVSRSATTAGTEVPVVRESEFHISTPIQLLNVPTDALFRLALRIFEMNLDHTDFGVQIFDQATNSLLTSTRVSTSTQPQGAERFTPGFVELDDFAVPNGKPVRIQIQPLNSGAAFWSYVSVTNNDSQQITLVTPQ
jgi:hypothetical protein